MENIADLEFWNIVYQNYTPKEILQFFDMSFNGMIESDWQAVPPPESEMP